MLFPRVSLVLSFCLSSLLAAPASASPRVTVSRANWARVLKVHRCEEPTWTVDGPSYQGGLGWSHATWMAWRAPWMPTDAARATPRDQAWAMVRFVALGLHYWPHQGWPLYCGPGY